MLLKMYVPHQSSVQAYRIDIIQYLFTVNAGSNTVSMFAIDPESPRHLRLVGKPVDTLGEFPQSVAYSPRLQTGKSPTLLISRNPLIHTYTL